MAAAEYCPSCNEAVLWKCPACQKENDRSVHTYHNNNGSGDERQDLSSLTSPRAMSLVGAALTVASGLCASAPI